MTFFHLLFIFLHISYYGYDDDDDDDEELAA